MLPRNLFPGPGLGRSIGRRSLGLQRLQVALHRVIQVQGGVHLGRPDGPASRQVAQHYPAEVRVPGQAFGQLLARCPTLEQVLVRGHRRHVARSHQGP